MVGIVKSGAVTLSGGDLEIGAVEIKDAGTDVRAPVSATTGLTVNCNSSDVTIDNAAGSGVYIQPGTSAVFQVQSNSANIATETTVSAINTKLVSGTDIGDVTINNANGGSAVNIQDGGNTITVDGAVTIAAARTPTHTAPVIGAADTTALAANANRLAAEFVNDSSETIYLNLSAIAVMNQGIRLNANGGSYTMSREQGNLYVGEVSGICASGSKTLLVIEFI